ncbi:MAG: hypothetical protein FWC16_06750 [Defluviitaleaceae bacterium]|nr:hypothetical protein [Defluviitaleaceae bacterium]MCL2274609.1 hypothetical protein [Defluviitaleaceae bacterium]
MKKALRFLLKYLLFFMAVGGVILLLPLLILLFLLVMFAPLRYAVVARVGGETTVRAKARYLFISFRYLLQKGESKTQIRIFGFPIKTKAPTKEPEKKTTFEEIIQEKADEIIPADEEPKDTPKDVPPPKPEEKKPSKLRSILTYPQLKTIISLVYQCLKKTLRILLPKKLNISGTVGFDDPAATGMFFGAYAGIASALRLREKVRLTADFAEAGVRLKISAGGSISIARLTLPVLWLACKKPFRAFIRFLLKKDERND